MLINYSAIDGFRIGSGSVIATLMGETSADMLLDRVESSPLNALTENGTITYTAVANNSSTLWASDFSGSNYFTLPYIAALDAGTNGLSAKIWFNTQNGVSGNDVFFTRHALSSSPIGPYWLVKITSAGLIDIRLIGASATVAFTSTVAYDDDADHMVSFDYDNATLNVYIDGDFIGSTAGVAGSLSNSNAELRVGCNGAGGEAASTSKLTGLEIEIGAQWTAQEHKQKYESEKVLFSPLELFSIVGRQIQYESNLLTAGYGHIINDAFTESLSGVRQSLTHNRKQSFTCSPVPFARSSLPAAKKFLKSCNRQAFSYDERGSTSNSPNADNPITVYKTSQNEQITYNNPYYSYSFSLREA